MEEQKALGAEQVFGVRLGARLSRYARSTMRELIRYMKIEELLAYDKKSVEFTE